jgi:tRNA-specific 2-thiouridylase
MAMGADMIATGHYARSESRHGHVVLRKGSDPGKDQSYFLYSIGEEALMRAIFPLGDYTKEGLRALAVNQGLRCALSRESQDICFIPKGNYAEFLSRFIKPKRGRVYLPDGTLLGFHEGIHLFTIGQRRGINVPYREALYVIDIRADENSIVVGTKNDLRTHTLTARSVSLLCPVSTPISARVRYRQPDKPCSCEFRDETLSVTFNEPVDGVTPGQSVVLYHDDIVVGGGVIEKRVAM